MNYVQQIKDKLDILDVVSDYVDLERFGRLYRGFSPFNEEKTPSFVVSPDKQIAFCFSSNRGGDMFKIVQELEGCDFHRALEILAQKAGIDITQSATRYCEADIMKKMYNDATDIYRSFYKGSPAEKYMEKRGIGSDVCEEFMVGYAPPESIISLMKEMGHSEEDMIRGGLVYRSTGIHIRDAFNGRVMFPYYDGNDVVGFSSRTLGDGIKYINTPDSPQFKKSNVMFGYKQALPAIKATRTVNIVEGQIDVLSMAALGYRDTVAASGSCMSKHCLSMLARHADLFYIVFDGDDAGRKASRRCVGDLLVGHPSKHIYPVVLPDGKDPGNIGGDIHDLMREADDITRML